MLTLLPAISVFVATGVTDLRKSFDGLIRCALCLGPLRVGDFSPSAWPEARSPSFSAMAQRARALRLKRRNCHWSWVET